MIETSLKLTEFSAINESTKLSETQYYKVAKIQGERLQLVNDYGENIIVSKQYAESCLVTADQFSEQKQVNKTEAAAIFLANPSIVMTVNFNKQVKVADVEKEIMEAYDSSTPKLFETAMKKAVKRGLSGEERTIVGRHYGGQNEFGRVNFIDMNLEKDESKDYDTRIRQVDPRTINYLIVNNVKHTVK